MSRLLTLSGVLLVVALVARSEIVGIVATALGAASLISRLWIRQIERALRIERIAPESLPFGEEATISVVVKNGALVRIPWLELRESVSYALRTTAPPRTVVTLGAGAQHRMTYVVRGARRGWYPVGPLQLTLGDVLGLQRLNLTVPARAVTVYPRVVPLAALGLPATLSFGPLRPLHQRQHTEDPARPSGVRQYVPGDDVRRLDWKSSARQSTLLVRRADPTIAPETTIVLAFGRHDYPGQVLQDAVERAVVVAVSFGIALLERKLPVALVTNGFDPAVRTTGVALRFGKGDGHRRLLLNLLGRIEVGHDLDVFGLLQAQQLPWGGTLVLVLSDLTLEMLPHLLGLRRRGQQIALVLVEGTHAGRALAQQQRLSVYSVDQRGLAVAERGL